MLNVSWKGMKFSYISCVKAVRPFQEGRPVSTSRVGDETCFLAGDLCCLLFAEFWIDARWLSQFKFSK